MFVLAKFTPILPYPGLIFWTIIIFGLFWIIMRNFAFKPIVEALEKRDTSIQKALEDSKAARAEMENFKGESAKFLGEARAEQSSIMKEARAKKEQMINDAKDVARAEANKIIASARAEINTEKASAIAEMKKDSGVFALQIAEKVIKKQLMGKDDNESFANGLINDIKLN